MAEFPDVGKRNGFDRASRRGDPLPMDAWFAQNQLELLRSIGLLHGTIEELKLAERWFSGSEVSALQAMKRLRPRVQVRRYRDTMLYEVKVMDEDPALASEVANTLVRRYQEVVRNPELGGLLARVRIADPAYPVLRPVHPNVPLWVFLGVMIAVGSAFLTTLGCWVAAMSRRGRMDVAK